MTARDLRLTLSVLALYALLGSHPAAANELSKEACVDAHARGQDAREQGKLSSARASFLSCAQERCPALVREDCARFADELDRLQPWISFAARDERGRDLLDTVVYVDEQLLLTRLDEGKAHAVDPGRHVVRFSHAGRDETLTIVVGSGEKGRTLIATFAALAPSNAAAAPTQLAPVEATTAQAKGVRALIFGGAGLVAMGTALGIAGLARVPSSCSLASHDCAAPPGDATFGEAEKAVRWSNAGWTTAALGAATLAAGLVWHFRRARPSAKDGDEALAPSLAADGLGFRARW